MNPDVVSNIECATNGLRIVTTWNSELYETNINQNYTVSFQITVSDTDFYISSMAVEARRIDTGHEEKEGIFLKMISFFTANKF